MQNKEIIYKLLQQKCEAISVRAPKGNHNFTGLVAFRDDLIFPLSDSLTDTAGLFSLAHKAIMARFDFAKESHRLSRGASEDYCTEFMVIPVMDDTNNQPTGDIRLCAQFVLREINPASSQSAENPPIPKDSPPIPESPHP